ncbi:MAG: DUF559 domain-containing protein [Alphaproteobacteria bacterium]|nr:DUF559 domain-containing protein [Alphaproteobacteria bacterium]
MRAKPVTVRRARCLRRTLSLPEVLLWQDMRAGKLGGLRIRRQHALGPYILDFFCPSARLAIEIDGASHDTEAQAGHDARRDGYLRAEGIEVIRFPAKDILDDRVRETVLQAILAAASRH